MDWDKWLDLLQVAVLAKFSISITELNREVNEQNPRARALSGGMDEDAAKNKVVSVLSLSLGEAARKLFEDKYPHTTLCNLQVRALIQLSRYCFEKKETVPLTVKICFKYAATR